MAPSHTWHYINSAGFESAEQNRFMQKQSARRDYPWILLNPASDPAAPPFSRLPELVTAWITAHAAWYPPLCSSAWVGVAPCLRPSVARPGSCPPSVWSLVSRRPP